MVIDLHGDLEIWKQTKACYEENMNIFIKHIGIFLVIAIASFYSICLAQTEMASVAFGLKAHGAGWDRIIASAIDKSNGDIVFVGSYSADVILYNSDDTTGYTLPKSTNHMAGVFIAKYSEAGVYKWSARVDGSYDDNVLSVVIDSNGNVILTGQYKSLTLKFHSSNGVLTSKSWTPSDFAVYIVQFTSAGIFSWAARMDCNFGDQVTGISLDSSNNIIVSGNCFTNTNSFRFYNADGTTYTALQCENSYGGYIGKYSSQGAFQLAMRVQDSIGNWNTNQYSDDYIESIAVDSNNDIIAVGYSESGLLYIYEATSANIKETFTNGGNTGTFFGFIVKYSSSGAYLWAAKIDGLSSEKLESVAVDNNRNIIVAGFTTSSTMNIENENGNVAATASTASGFIIKYSPAGNFVWRIRVNINAAFYVATDFDGNIIVGGSFSSSFQIYNVTGQVAATLSSPTSSSAVFKYSPSGSLLWAVKLDGSGSDVLTSISTDANNTVFVTGYTTSSSISVSGTNDVQIGGSLTNANSNELGFLFKICPGVCVSTSAFSCPSNAICNMETSTFSCNAGYAINSTANTCTLCPLGFFKNSTGNTNCTVCPVGQQSVQNRTFCTQCSIGTYRSSINSPACLTCPANSQCAPNQFTCNQGYRSNQTNNGCDQCPIGTESNPNRDLCVPCSSTSYRPNLSFSSCISCPNNAICTTVGFTCNQGYRLNSTNNGCDQCPIGTESSPSRNLCVPCSSTSYRPALSFPTCISCPNNANCSTTGFTCNLGYRLNSTNNGCDQCPIGTESNANRTDCISCKSGFYRPTLNISPNCVKCPDNSYCTPTSFTCLAGYQPNGTAVCSSCPTGHVKPQDGNATCTKCNIGEEPNANRTVCVECSDGFIKPTEEYLVCAECPEGARCSPRNLTCLAGYTPNQNRSFSCLHCEEGYFKQLEGNVGCDQCHSGFYSSDDYTTCFSCPAGFFMNSTGSCNRCGVGRQPIFNRTFCIDCPTNTYKPNDIFNLCLKCPTGATCTTTSFTCNAGFEITPPKNGCRRCLSGYYKQKPGNEENCVSCPVGYQSLQDRTNCEPCINSYRPSLNSAFCQPCPPNSVCSLDNFACLDGFVLVNGACIAKTLENAASINNDESPIVTTADGKSQKTDSTVSENFTWNNFYTLPIFYAFFIPILIFFIISTWSIVKYLMWREKEIKRFGLLTKQLDGEDIYSSRAGFSTILSTQQDTTNEYIE